MAVALSSWGTSALADVDLNLQTTTPQAGVGAEFEVRLIAKSSSATPEAISGLDAILVWNPAFIELLGAQPNSAQNWLLAGLFNDELAEGINNTFSDGNAYFQALSQFTAPAMATPTGLPVADFRFRALASNVATEVQVVSSLGGETRTRVFRFNQVNQDIVSGLGSLPLKILSRAMIASSDVSIPAGRQAEVWVYGALQDGMTFGATVMVELVPRDNAIESVEFTPAPPIDVVQLGDPWPGFGTFTPFDSNVEAAAAPNLNGSVDDNGSFVPVSLTYHGGLAGFPVMASSGASGEWEVRLTTIAGNSHWEGIATAVESGVLRIVDLGDGDGDSLIDLRDASELQNCFTGERKGQGTSSFSRDPARRCGVYDFDNDGDIDAADYGPFKAALLTSQE